nr:unnamed protein product [Callosobruchus chinensis]
MRCFSRIKGQRRKFAFECFWKIGDFSTQNAYICGLVKQTFIVRRRPRSGNRCEKTTTNTYYVNAENTSEKVCKTYFLQTFQISNGRLGRALKRARVSSPGEDLRGRHEPANKTPDAKIQMVRDHINSFPSYQSHYTRSHNSNRKYLDSKLNLRLMYGLYKEKYGNNGDAPVSEAIYRHVFHHDFNLHFHVPSKDTCVRCDLFKAKLNCATDDNVKKTINQEHTLHLRKSEKARQSLIDDKSACILNRGEVYGFTFDLEKALPFPTLTCSLAYYKRNMYVYNLGIHELGEDEKGFMYVWNETIASRGAQEIGSCIRTHIATYAKGASKIIAYSDACGGQNRNFKQCLLWLKLLADTAGLETIDHKFMVSGHSFLPNDRDFGHIEQHAKNTVKYVPEYWYSLIKKCRPRKPFCVYEMQKTNFVSSKPLEEYVLRRKKNEQNNPVSWLRIQWLHFEKHEAYKIYYKETLNEDWSFEVINLQQNRKGAPKLFKNINLPPLYDSPRPVNNNKKKNMEELLQFIPPIHHNFFKDLNIDENVEDIGPLEEALEEED